MTSVTLVSSLVLLCWKLCAATAACHRLAYWWVQVHNTKVGWLLYFFRRERRSSEIHEIVIISDETFQRLLWLSEKTEELAIQDSLCTDTRLQFTATNVTCKGLTIARKSSDYSWWPEIDELLYSLRLSHSRCTTGILPDPLPRLQWVGSGARDYCLATPHSLYSPQPFLQALYSPFDLIHQFFCGRPATYFNSFYPSAIKIWNSLPNHPLSLLLNLNLKERFLKEIYQM